MTAQQKLLSDLLDTARLRTKSKAADNIKLPTMAGAVRNENSVLSINFVWADSVVQVTRHHRQYFSLADIVERHPTNCDDKYKSNSILTILKMKKEILKVTAIAGSLDILAAFCQGYLTSKISPSFILQYIASGVFGKSAFEGGLGIQFMGLLFHFIIAFACVTSYYLVYPKIKYLKINWLLNAFIISVVAWTVTNLLIIPLSQIAVTPFNFSKSLIAITILFFCIGLPISFFAKKFYKPNGD
jgi:hypothetical protein